VPILLNHIGFYGNNANEAKQCALALYKANARIDSRARPLLRIVAEQLTLRHSSLRVVLR